MLKPIQGNMNQTTFTTSASLSFPSKESLEAIPSINYVIDYGKISWSVYCAALKTLEHLQKVWDGYSKEKDKPSMRRIEREMVKLGEMKDFHLMVREKIQRSKKKKREN